MVTLKNMYVPPYHLAKEVPNREYLEEKILLINTLLV